MLVTSRSLERQLEQLLEDDIMNIRLRKQILTRKLNNDALRTSADIATRQSRRTSGFAFSDDEDGQRFSRRDRGQPTSRRATSAPKRVTIPQRLSDEARCREIGRPNNRVTLTTSPPPMSHTEAGNHEIMNRNMSTAEDQRWSAQGSAQTIDLPRIEAHVTDADLTERTLPADIFPEALTNVNTLFYIMPITVNR